MCYHSVHRQTKQKEPKSLLNYCLAGTKPHLMYQLLLTQTSSRTSRTITGRQRDIIDISLFEQQCLNICNVLVKVEALKK